MYTGDYDGYLKNKSYFTKTRICWSNIKEKWQLVPAGKYLFGKCLIQWSVRSLYSSLWLEGSSTLQHFVWEYQLSTNLWISVQLYKIQALLLLNITVVLSVLEVTLTKGKSGFMFVCCCLPDWCHTYAPFCCQPLSSDEVGQQREVVANATGTDCPGKWSVAIWKRLH